MERAFTNAVHNVPFPKGPTARIRIQQYPNGDTAFLAAPSKGEMGEAPALEAIGIIHAQAVAMGIEPRACFRVYRLMEGQPKAMDMVILERWGGDPELLLTAVRFGGIAQGRVN